MNVEVGIVTISDRASAGVYADQSGPALAEAVATYGWQVRQHCLVPDEVEAIQTAVKRFASIGCQLVLTTGGTGIGERDVTPEAIRAIASKELPGFGEVMRAESLKLTPNAILSRSLAASIDRTLILCLPGKPTAATQCLGFVVPAVAHCIEILCGSTGSH
jgi:molybdopterin adenylyltransferase